jgi:transposase
MPNDLPPWEIVYQQAQRWPPESGARAGYDGAKRKKGSKLHLAVDTLGHMLALHVTPASVGDRDAVGQMARNIQAATDESVEIAFVDQGYTGERAAAAAAGHGIELSVVKLPQAKRGFVLLPNESKAARERLTLIRLFEELRGLAMSGVTMRFVGMRGAGVKSVAHRPPRPMCH